jgi:hypothetical protein
MHQEQHNGNQQSATPPPVKAQDRGIDLEQPVLGKQSAKR